MAVKIAWEVDDGYVGKNRPRHVEIDQQDIDACETQEELEALIYEYIEDEFNNRISYGISGDMPRLEDIKTKGE